MQFASPEHFFRKEDSNKHEFIAYERLLGQSIKPFIAELYTVNPGVMAYYISTERNENVRDIVDSSAEALRRPELLRYAHAAAIQIDWQQKPEVTIRLEFRHHELMALFDLVFHGSYVGIDIVGIRFREAPESAEDTFRRFASAIADLKVLNS